MNMGHDCPSKVRTAASQLRNRRWKGRRLSVRKNEWTVWKGTSRAQGRWVRRTRRRCLQSPSLCRLERQTLSCPTRVPRAV